MKILRLLVLAIVLVSSFFRLVGVDLGASLLWGAGVAEAILLLIVVSGFIRLRRVRTEASGDGSQPRGWEALHVVLRESLPERVAEAALYEMRMFVAALATLGFRPLRSPSASGATRFGAMQSRAYSGTVWTLVVLLLIETPAVHLSLGATMDEGIVRSVSRSVLLLSSIYLGLWLLGDLRLLQESPGVVLGHGRLEIDLGLRARGEVPFDAVVRAERISSDVGEGRKEDDATPIRITPMPSPNCRIWLRHPVTIRGLVGLPMRGDRLDIYVDDPDSLVTALERLLGPTSS